MNASLRSSGASRQVRPPSLDLKKPPGVLVSMGRHIKNLRVPRIDDDVIDEQLRAIEVHQQSPVARAISRSIDLPIKSAEIKAIRITRIHHQASHIAARGTGNTPLAVIRHRRESTRLTAGRPVKEVMREQKGRRRNCQDKELKVIFSLINSLSIILLRLG